ncbi:uncharacterized protein LOC116106446 [Pistacia vera]|uniref:uncharacterized protein LOC116106446 n=1 Tax=Pistacia vera TaxID=55513 RepID=UPI001263D467|nr:uncharacterized protein LOC116106446 [Pistacia vera]
MLSKVNISLPILDVIRNMLSYANFFKELNNKKRRYEKNEKDMVSKVASAVLQQNFPPKLKDPRSFNINITIGDKKIAKAMIDLGASINLMPYSIYLALGLGELKPTTMTLQLADRSVKYPKGIVENSLVQVDKLIVPIEFVVLEMEELSSKDKEHTILLGRPVMATTKTIVDVHKGKLSMIVLGETVEFKVFGSLPIPTTSTFDECSFIDCVDSLVYDTYLQEKIEDKLEAALTLDRIVETLDKETKGFHEILDRSLPVLPQEKSSKPLELPTSPHRDELNPPKLEFKKYSGAKERIIRACVGVQTSKTRSSADKLRREVKV